MRRLIVSFLLLIIFFIFPLHVYVIGDQTGIGVQGAVFRYQITIYGNSLIPVTRDIMYIVSGLYTGKTALSVIVWGLGTILLTITTWFGLVNADGCRSDYYQQVIIGIVASCICYFISCIAQYGIFFHGPPGTSIPFGICLILVWIGYFSIFPRKFQERNP